MALQPIYSFVCTLQNIESRFIQADIAQCCTGERLRVYIRSQDWLNPNAIAITRETGESIGQLALPWQAEILSRTSDVSKVAAILLQINRAGKRPPRCIPIVKCFVASADIDLWRFEIEIYDAIEKCRADLMEN